MALTYLPVCSGIEAATVAWHPLGWSPVAFSEIEPFPAAVLAHHYPDTPNLGDMTKHKEWPDADVDVLVGGTPCQSFSVAGLRKGMADPRGNLALVFLAIADRFRPRWLVWENVPGVLSSNGGRDFGAFLGGLGELGYGWSYRVLDAQYFGVPQRRRRVFVVGHIGDWRRATAILFERESLRRNSPPSREARQDAAGSTGDGVARCVTAGEDKRQDWESCTFVTHSLRADGFDASEDGTGRGTPLVPMVAPCLTQNYGKQPDNSDTSAGPMLVPVAFDLRGREGGAMIEGPHDTVNIRAASGGSSRSYVAFAENSRVESDALVPVAFQSVDHGADAQFELSPTLRRHDPMAVATASAVRRLTPTECERLQGFPDGHTLVPYRGKPAADGPRYKALGNSMAVPVMRWIGERIAAVDEVTTWH